MTEQGIRQSFDLTKVMFSRGNITEKIRFGQLVQPGELVLDLYAGIGYFTLPALVHGRAKHVVACEWNPDAAQALRYNLQDNQVDDRATVHVGDCRQIAKEQGLVDTFHRVSLGLLPSSEGGWKTALLALSKETGGWLHVHGNVPVREAQLWQEWMCRRFLRWVKQREMQEAAAAAGTEYASWMVVGHHLEKVKSFAPNVNHYVSDVYCGPYDATLFPTLQPEEEDGPCIVWREGVFCKVNATVLDQPPSCALSADGVLHQEWMRLED